MIVALLEIVVARHGSHRMKHWKVDVTNTYSYLLRKLNITSTNDKKYTGNLTITPEIAHAQYCVPCLYISAGTPSKVVADMWLN